MDANRDRERMQQEIEILKQTNAALQKEISLLKEFKDNFISLFSSSNEAIVIIDAHTGKIVQANPAVEAILGYEIRDLIGEHFSVLFPPDLKSFEMVLPDEPLFEDDAFKQEFFRPDGTVCLLDFTAAMITWNQQTSIMAVFREDFGW